MIRSFVGNKNGPTCRVIHVEKIDMGCTMEWPDGLVSRPCFTVLIDLETGVLVGAEMDRSDDAEQPLKLLTALIDVLAAPPLGMILGNGCDRDDVCVFLIGAGIRVFSPKVYNRQEIDIVSHALAEVEAEFLPTLRGFGVREAATH